MKKTIKLTEKDLTNLIKKVINEGTYNDNSKMVDKITNILRK